MARSADSSEPEALTGELHLLLESARVTGQSMGPSVSARGSRGARSDDRCASPGLGFAPCQIARILHYYTTTDHRAWSEGCGPMASRDWLEYAAVMFTCFAAGAASVSAYYASRQADVAQQTADKQLRPYVLIDPQTIITDVQFLANRATTGKVHFKNFGVTPAYRVRLIARLDVVRWPLAKNFSFGKARILFENIVAPPSAQMYTTFTDQDKMTDTEFADVLIGAQRILVYGTLYYSQGDKHYQTNFCASLVPPINGRFSEADTCLVHNEAI